MDFETGALSRIFRFVAALWRKTWSIPLAKPTKSLPQELRDARLIYAERLFRSLSPVMSRPCKIHLAFCATQTAGPKIGFLRVVSPSSQSLMRTIHADP